MSNEVLPPITAEIFRSDRLITSILGCVRSGKEATVWSCAAHPRTGQTRFALKAYRRFDHRSFHHDAIYRTGRVHQQTRVARAINQRSTFGLLAACAHWVDEEYQALQSLHAAGVRVPHVIARTKDAVLMEWIGDDAGPAPQLRETSADAATARRLWRGLIIDISKALAANRIHGDLSPYNILRWKERLVLIDLPQCVDARHNPAAEMLFYRDIAHIAAWFCRQGFRVDHEHWANRLWRAWVVGEDPTLADDGDSFPHRCDHPQG